MLHAERLARSAVPEVAYANRLDDPGSFHGAAKAIDNSFKTMHFAMDG